jgi:hypothetical protein
VEAVTPAALKIVALFNAWLALYAQEDDALKKIMKSVFTEDLHVADHVRDEVYSGMAEANRSALKHFRAEVKVAAKRLKIVFDTYGNVARLPLNEETAAIYNLLQELNGNYASDVATVGIGDWVQELEAQNNAFEHLYKERYDETALRTDLVMKDVRTQIDAAYRTIIERIDALCVIEGSEIYTTFIKRLNAVVEKYHNNVAMRKK